jgi:hypothetical protein
MINLTTVALREEKRVDFEVVEQPFLQTCRDTFMWKICDQLRY